MSPSRFQLECATLGEVGERVAERFGPSARVIAVEAVTTGGIQGFFAQRHYEVTVEVPDHDPGLLRGASAEAYRFDRSTRSGIAALLEDADAAELNAQRYSPAGPAAAASGASSADEKTWTVPPAAAPAPPQSAPPGPRVSTTSTDFATLLANLTVNTGVVGPVLPAVAGPLIAPGDLVLLVGLGEDAHRVAEQMAAGSGAMVRSAGTVQRAGAEPIDVRRQQVSVRAAAVEQGRSVLLAWGLPTRSVDFVTADALGRLHADQVWVVVDASRKPEDTVSWVNAVRAAVSVDAVAVIGRGFTATPDSSDILGLPIGWSESPSVG